MKDLQNKYYFFVFFLFGMLRAFADGVSPPPPDDPVVTADGLPPPPPGFAIDENIFMLLSIAILFGIYIIYKNNLKTKSSI
ncbi:hypothetical protein QO200_10290 [Flavobacterium sp. Arc3]|uniref:hypothetical protein n=1 Tax=Flavobacterium sp. Arc3 TaxID=3046686 RepID=UPI00352D4002